MGRKPKPPNPQIPKSPSPRSSNRQLTTTQHPAIHAMWYEYRARWTILSLALVALGGQTAGAADQREVSNRAYRLIATLDRGAITARLDDKQMNLAVANGPIVYRARSEKAKAECLGLENASLAVDGQKRAFAAGWRASRSSTVSRCPAIATWWTKTSWFATTRPRVRRWLTSKWAYAAGCRPERRGPARTGARPPRGRPIPASGHRSRRLLPRLPGGRRGQPARPDVSHG